MHTRVAVRHGEPVAAATPGGPRTPQAARARRLARDSRRAQPVRPYPLAQELLGPGSAGSVLSVADAPAPTYVRHRPEETVLYQVVSEHLESFLQLGRETYRGGLPRYVEKEFRAYLNCGLLCRGFLRAWCDGCGKSVLVAFSCKRHRAPPGGCAIVRPT